MVEGNTEKDDEIDEEVKKSNDYDVDVTKWINAQVPKGRTKFDRSKNRAIYIELLLADVPYRELVIIAKKKYNEDFSLRGFCLLNRKIPREIKNPIERMEKFIKEAPYRVNEILMMEELVTEQRKRFMDAGNFEAKAPVPLSSRSQVARDLHSLLVDLQEAKMKSGVITRVPEVIEISNIKSVSQYSEEDKKKELERIDNKLRGIGGEKAGEQSHLG